MNGQVVFFFLNAYYGIVIRNTAKLLQERREIIHLEQKGRQSKALKKFISSLRRAFAASWDVAWWTLLCFVEVLKARVKLVKRLECTVSVGFLSISVRGPFKFTRYFVETSETSDRSSRA